MKLFLILIAVLLLANSALQAQYFDKNYDSTAAYPKPENNYKRIITFAPLGIGNKFRFRYEKALSKNFSIGTQITYYHGQSFSFYPGLHTELVGRYYLDATAPNGFYVFGQGGFAYHQLKVRYDTDINSLSSSTYGNFSQLEATGAIAGIGIGYQTTAGANDRFVIDYYFGLKGTFMNTRMDTFKSYSNNNISSSGTEIGMRTYYISGPGSILNCGFNLGFNF